MLVHKKLLMFHKLCARALVASVAALLVAGAARAEIIEQILVKVNGEIFTKSDLETHQIQLLRQKGEQIDLKDANNAQLRKALDEITPEIMVQVVDEMLVVQRGRELGYKLSDDQFKQVVENIRRENKIDTEEQWQAALKAENMTMSDLRRQLERQMIVSRVQQNEVFGKIGVSEDEARKYYDAHQNEFTTPPSVTLREVLVEVKADAGKGLNVAQDEAAKDRADAARARAAGGESFEKLVAEMSDSASRTNGGLIGPISLADVSPELRTLIQGMKPGDISPVIRTQRGYQVLKLESTTAVQTMPFEQAREQISDRVFTDKRKEEFQKYLEKLRKEAIIEWKNADVKKAWEEGVAAQAAAPAQPTPSH